MWLTFCCVAAAACYYFSSHFFLHSNAFHNKGYQLASKSIHIGRVECPCTQNTVMLCDVMCVLSTVCLCSPSLRAYTYYLARWLSLHTHLKCNIFEYVFFVGSIFRWAQESYFFPVFHATNCAHTVCIVCNVSYGMKGSSPALIPL